MRRASTCLAVLGLGLLGAAGRRLGGADRQVQSRSRADPGLHGHRQHPRRRRRGPSRIHDRRHRIRRVPAAADRRQLLPAARAPSCTRRASYLREDHARTDRVRSGCPKAPRPVPRATRSASCLRQRTCRRGPRRSCSPSTRPAAALSSSPTATRRCRWKSSRQGHYFNLSGAAATGQELITEVPLVATVPGAPYASVKTINVKAGSAYKKSGKAIYYGRVPTKCPKGGFPFKTELIFAETGRCRRSPEPVTATYKAPCPRKK